MRWPSISLFAGLIFSFFSSVTISSPVNSIHLGTVSRYQISKQDWLLKRNLAASIPLHTELQPLRQRSFVDDLGEGWQMFLTHGEYFVPVQEAAADLREFYRWTMSEAMDYMLMKHQQYDYFAFKSGHLAMTWSCSRTGIPWILVHTFTSHMLEATYRGFTGQYSMRFRHTEGLVIDVALQILPVAIRALHGSSSSNTR